MKVLALIVLLAPNFAHADYPITYASVAKAFTTASAPAKADLEGVWTLVGQTAANDDSLGGNHAVYDASGLDVCPSDNCKCTQTLEFRNDVNPLDGTSAFEAVDQALSNSDLAVTIGATYASYKWSNGDGYAETHACKLVKATKLLLCVVIPSQTEKGVQNDYVLYSQQLQ